MQTWAFLLPDTESTLSLPRSSLTGLTNSKQYKKKINSLNTHRVILLALLFCITAERCVP